MPTMRERVDALATAMGTDVKAIHETLTAMAADLAQLREDVDALMEGGGPTDPPDPPETTGALMFGAYPLMFGSYPLVFEV